MYGENLQKLKEDQEHYKVYRTSDFGQLVPGHKPIYWQQAIQINGTIKIQNVRINSVREYDLFIYHACLVYPTINQNV